MATKSTAAGAVTVGTRAEGSGPAGAVTAGVRVQRPTPVATLTVNSTAGGLPREAIRTMRAASRWMNDAGMATAEYAVATLAACGFAGVLVVLLRSGEVRSLLLGIIRRALAGQ